MRRRSALLLVAGLAACRSSTPPPPAVLTLLPAAFEGGKAKAEELCLSPGQAVRAAVWVSQPSVTFTVRGSAEQGGVLEAGMGDDAASADASGEPMEVTFRLRPAAGLQTLRLARPQTAGGDVCIAQVALTQP